MVAQTALTVTLALAALAPVYRVSEVSLGAPLAVLALGVVLAGLAALPRFVAHRVSIALTGGARGEVPGLLGGGAGRTVVPYPRPRPAGRLSVVCRLSGKWARHPALLAVPQSRPASFVAPPAGRVCLSYQTLLSTNLILPGLQFT